MKRITLALCLLSLGIAFSTAHAQQFGEGINKKQDCKECHKRRSTIQRMITGEKPSLPADHWGKMDNNQKTGRLMSR